VCQTESIQSTKLRRPRRRLVGYLACGLLGLGILLASGIKGVSAGQGYAIAMHGAPALAADFVRMPYANPDAPKGGRLVHGILGTFDSLNPLIVRGLAVQQIRGFVVESLMARGNDEAFTLYGLLARSVETDDTRSYVTFRLDPRARFSDGLQVTATTCCFRGLCYVTKGVPTIASIIPRSQRPKPLIRSPCVSILAAPGIANCR